MNAATTLTTSLTALSAGDWFNLFLYYLSLSLLAVGGAIATAPDMHRYLVERNAWLTDPQFNASIAIAQAAPGPNVLFIALLGWNVGINAGGPGLAGWLLGSITPSMHTAMPRAPSSQPARPGPPPAGATATASGAGCAPSSKAWRRWSLACCWPPRGC